MNVREMCSYSNSDSEFRPVLQKVCFMHVRQCHWCTGKAYSPNHRFSSPETELWPSDFESPPTASQATEAGKEKRGDKRETKKKGKMTVTGSGKLKIKKNRGKIGQGQ